MCATGKIISTTYYPHLNKTDINIILKLSQGLTINFLLLHLFPNPLAALLTMTVFNISSASFPESLHFIL
jgi:hypothetical protein